MSFKPLSISIRDRRESRIITDYPSMDNSNAPLIYDTNWPQIVVHNRFHQPNLVCSSSAKCWPYKLHRLTSTKIELETRWRDQTKDIGRISGYYHGHSRIQIVPHNSTDIHRYLSFQTNIRGYNQSSTDLMQISTSYQCFWMVRMKTEFEMVMLINRVALLRSLYLDWIENAPQS